MRLLQYCYGIVNNFYLYIDVVDIILNFAYQKKLSGYKFIIASGRKLQDLKIKWRQDF